MTDAPVVIAGGGIAGLSAALALARAGRQVQVFERDPQRTEEGAGLQLSPNASRHLRSWGILSALEGQALAPDRIVVRRGTDALTLAELSLADAERRYGAPFRVAHRADLHAALLDAATAQPGVSIQPGRAITGWRVDGSSLRISTTQDEIIAAALVIADGVGSALREQIAAASTKPVIDTRRVAWRALVPAELCASFAQRPATNLWLGPDAHVVHYPLRGGSTVNIVAIIGQDGPTTNDAFWSGRGEGGHLRRRLGAWHKDLRELIAAADTWRTWPLLARAAPDRLAFGRVALIGDAAHPMMPFLAQGGAQAIEDAAALGDAFTKSADAETALRAYERARLVRVRRVVAASERQAMIYHLRGPAAAARDFGMRAVGSVGMRAMTEWIWRA